MAAVSVLEALLLLGTGAALFMVYRKVMTLVDGIEQRQVAPAMARVNAILDDVKEVSGKVKAEADRVDTAIHSTMDRIDDTADRVRTSVRAKKNNILGYVKGVRAAIEAMRHFRPRTESL
jgi:hypothetical protein